MITAGSIYWMTVITQLRNVFLFATGMILTLVVIVMLNLVDEDHEDNDYIYVKAWPFLKILIAISLFTGAAAIFLPSKQTLIAMHVIPKIENNNCLKQLPISIRE